MLGEEGKKLDMKALEVARRLEVQFGWQRPDLSFPPAATQTTSR